MMPAKKQLITSMRTALCRQENRLFMMRILKKTRHGTSMQRVLWKGQGYHGERDNQVYLNGLLQKADPELRYEAVTVGEKRYLINTSGNIQKASSTSTSSAKPELGKGFKRH